MSCTAITKVLIARDIENVQLEADEQQNVFTRRFPTGNTGEIGRLFVPSTLP